MEAVVYSGVGCVAFEIVFSGVREGRFPDRQAMRFAEQTGRCGGRPETSKLPRRAALLSGRR